MKRRGFVWAISHSDWLDELAVSVKSCRRTMPSVERILFVTPDVDQAISDAVRSGFTSVSILDTSRHAHRPRFEAMLQCPLDEAVFIDSDTYFARPAHEIFEILEHYDLGALPAPQHIHKRAIEMGLHKKLPSVSLALPELNGGLLVASMTPALRQFVLKWSELFAICEAAGYQMDQFSLRVAVALSTLRLAYLPNIYNFRANIPQFVGGYVKIIHAHGELEKIAASVNSSASFRLYKPDPRFIHGFLPKRRQIGHAARSGAPTGKGA